MSGWRPVTVITVRSESALSAILADWARTMESNIINHAVSIERRPGGARVVTETGQVIQFQVRDEGGEA